MKIIEALKELPLIDKKIQKKKELISKYAAEVQNGQTELPFKTEEAQQKEVDSLIQSANDLVKRYTELKRRLAITNAFVKVDIDGTELTINEWITMREGSLQGLIDIQRSINDNGVDHKLTTVALDPEHGIKVIRFFDEKKRNDEIERLQNIKDKIDGTLEVVNATTDLMEGEG